VYGFENGGREKTSAISIGFGGLLGGSLNSVVKNGEKSNGF